MRKVSIIVAGGRGTRFGSELPKQFVDLCGEPILARTIRRFAASGEFDEIIVALPADEHEQWQSICESLATALPAHRVVAGGDTRFGSVKNALNACKFADGDIVAIHDGVRPFATVTLIKNLVKTAVQHGSALPLTKFPYSSSLREVLPDGSTVVVPRDALREVQTPQVFDAVALCKAFERDYESRFTDDATVWEIAGNKIVAADGDPDNIKITRPEDMELAEAIFRKQESGE